MPKSLILALIFFAVVLGVSYLFMGQVQLSNSLNALRHGELEKLEVYSQPIAPPDVALEGRNGSMRLADLKGQYSLVNIWATWCAPCLEEMPSLMCLNQQRGGEGFQVLIVSIDREGFAKTDPWLERLSIQGLDDYIDPTGRLPLMTESQQLPTTLIINPDGMLVAKVTDSLEWDGPDAQRLVDTLLKH